MRTENKNDFFSQSEELREKVRALQKDEALRSRRKLPGNCYFLNRDEIVCYPRPFGDSRYPYSVNGLNLWAHSSGTLYAEESTFHAFLDTTNGREPMLCFYVGEKREVGYFPISITGAGKWAFEKDVERYTVFTPDAVYYFAETDLFTACLRAFTDSDKNLRFSVCVSHQNNTPLDCYVSAYFEPMLSTAHFENIETKWFRSSRATDDGFTIRNTRCVARGRYVRNYAGILREKVGKVFSTTSRSVYKGGMNCQITCSSALINGKFDRDTAYTEFTDTAVAGDIIPLTIGKGEPFTVSYTVVLTENLADVSVSERTTAEIDGILADRKRGAEILPEVSFSSPTEERINEELFNYFLKNVFRQVDFCAKAKNYAGAFIGIRDVFQQLEAAIAWRPEYCRGKMIEALGYVGENGRVPRQYSYPDSPGALPAMDLREFVDQGVWIISTVYTYLAYTSDYGFLNERCGYYRYDGNVVSFSEREDGVLEHLIAITDYLLSKLDRETGCLRILYGDWNDALDGLGNSRDGKAEYGTGVSVMATLQFLRNLREMSEILEKTDRYAEKRGVYLTEAERIRAGLLKYAVVENEFGERKILHGWDDGRNVLVGSFCDGDGACRDGVTANAFWILSGMSDADVSLKKDILRAYDRLDSKYGIKTFEPYFGEENKSVGRIVYLPKGTAENGAVYLHATLFAVWSLFMVGESERAWKQIDKILPITHEFISTTPFVMPNSYVENVELGFDGESMSDWFTGSGCVLVKILISCVFGIRADLDGVRIAPCAYLPFRRARIDLQIKGARIELSYSGTDGGSRAFFVNGKERACSENVSLGVPEIYFTNDECKDSRLQIRIVD